MNAASTAPRNAPLADQPRLIQLFRATGVGAVNMFIATGGIWMCVQPERGKEYIVTLPIVMDRCDGMVEVIQSRRKVQWWYSTPKKEEPRKMLIKVGDIWVTPASEVPELDEGKAQAYAYRNIDY